MAGAVLYVCVVSPFFIVCMVPIIAYYRYVQAFFLKVASPSEIIVAAVSPPHLPHFPPSPPALTKN